MNKKQLLKVSDLIVAKINEMFDEQDIQTKKALEELYKDSDKAERNFNVNIDGDMISVNTDGDAYEMLFNSEYQCCHDNRIKIQDFINKKMGKKFANENHYFELYGMGRIDYA